MPIYSINQKLILFVHVPKTGGTSLERLFRSHPLFEKESMYEEGIANPFLRAARCSPQHWHADLLRQNLKLKSFDFIFTIVRDPVDRILSEYSMRIGQKKKNKYGNDLTDFFKWYRLWQARRVSRPFCLDNHLRPQNEFILKRSLIYCFDMGMEAIWLDICSRLEMDADEGVGVPHIRPGRGPVIRLGQERIDHIRKEIYPEYGRDDILYKRIASASSK